MTESLNIKNVVKHLANDSLTDLCLLCLLPLKEISFESIFTLICKEEREYCVADALEAVCQFQFNGTENYNICIECFKSASAAYKFHLQAKQSMEIITFYTEELMNTITNVEVTDEDTEKLLCIPLSYHLPETCLFDFNLDGLGQKPTDDDEAESGDTKEGNIIVVVEDGKTAFYKFSDGTLKAIKLKNDDEMLVIVNEMKVRKKRDPMAYLSCSRCPIKYRFISKLREHMKSAHNVEIYYCKMCKTTSENKIEYEVHLKTHRGNYQCPICNAVYKKNETLLSHMKMHQEGKVIEKSENANICELCGAILEDESSLEEHVSDKHVKKYTCYYCGRMYKGEVSFEKHIKKHEVYWKKKDGSAKIEQASGKSSEKAELCHKSKRSVCQTCGKDFVDERALLWHQRLHDNDRPFTCDTCGRGFVSKNRRNQHAVCAHTPPARRCPLCPALFHLRSMVNTHVKKVHLNFRKRRNRTTKRQNVFWRTEPVPIQELSVDVQHDVLELQSREAPPARAEMESSEAVPEQKSGLKKESLEKDSYLMYMED